MNSHWTLIEPDGVSSWWESSCGMSGEKPDENWLQCPFCGVGINQLDNKKDGYYWAKTKQFGVWRMLRKATDRQTWGQPWKDLEDGKRLTWLEIMGRYTEVVPVKKPVSTGS